MPDAAGIAAADGAPGRRDGRIAALRRSPNLWVAVVACTLFAFIATEVMLGTRVAAADRLVTLWFNGQATPEATRWILLVTDVHTPWAVCAAGALFAAGLGWRGQRDWVRVVAVVLPGGMLMNLLLKQAFQRARPVLDEPLLTLATYSFPSGHVVAATLFYGLLAAYAISRTDSVRLQVLLVALAALASALVGLTRVYLGVHHASDVLAAAAWSGAWLLAWLLVLPHARRPRQPCVSDA